MHICIIPASTHALRAVDVVEVGLVEARRVLAGIVPASHHNSRIVEHELDMVRTSERPTVVAGRIARVLSWLMPDGRHVAPPMRSVGRELEEAFPGHNY
jgi:hypothetical protein